MKIGDEVYIHGYVDEIRTGTVIIRNDGGYFGTLPEEIVDIVRCKDCVFRYGATEKAVYCATVGQKMNPDDYCSYGEKMEAAQTEPSATWLKDDEGTFICSAETEPKKGKWIYTSVMKPCSANGSYKCSVCDNRMPHETNFCPNCGADMRGDNHETN